jgi:hypothetical protein
MNTKQKLINRITTLKGLIEIRSDGPFLDHEHTSGEYKRFVAELDEILIDADLALRTDAPLSAGIQAHFPDSSWLPKRFIADLVFPIEAAMKEREAASKQAIREIVRNEIANVFEKDIAIQIVVKGFPEKPADQ